MVPLFPKPGEWVCFRGNQRLDAHSQAAGHIINPALAWKQYVGLIEARTAISIAWSNTPVPTSA
jgi:hypothetical protein